QTSAHDPLSYLPEGDDVAKWANEASIDPDGFTTRARASMAKHVAAMVGFADAGAEVFDYGNSIREEARLGGYERAFDFPGFVPAYIPRCSARGGARSGGRLCRAIRLILPPPIEPFSSCSATMSR